MKAFSPTAHPPHRITPQMLQTFLTCKERFRIEYELSLRRAGRGDWPWPPSVREAVSVMLEARDAARAGSEGDDSSRALAVYLDGARRAARPRSQQESSDVEVKLHQVRTEAAMIVANYVHANLPNRWNDRCTETAVRIGRSKEHAIGRIVECRLPTWSKGRLGRASRWTYAPRLDALYAEKSGDLTLVFRVFTSATGRQQILDEVSHSMHWRGHAWAAQEVTGRTVVNVVFDVVRAKAPSEPGTVKCGKCKGTGKGVLKDLAGMTFEGACPSCAGTGVGGISRAACDTTLWVFERALVRFPHLVDERRRHIDTLQRLAGSMDSFAFRVVQPVDQAGIRAWVQDAAQVVQQIGACRRAGAWQRNAYACMERGRQCPYRAPCAAPEAFAGTPFYTKVEYPFPGHRPWV